MIVKIVPLLKMYRINIECTSHKSMNSWKNQEKFKAKNKSSKNKGLKSWPTDLPLVIALYWQLFYVRVMLTAAFNRPSTRVNRRLIVVT